LDRDTSPAPPTTGAGRGSNRADATDTDREEEDGPVDFGDSDDSDNNTQRTKEGSYIQVINKGEDYFDYNIEDKEINKLVI
jgi:hypothetical protein